MNKDVVRKLGTVVGLIAFGITFAVCVYAQPSAAQPPRVLQNVDAGRSFIELPDATIAGFAQETREGMSVVTMRTSKDFGKNWDEPHEIIELPRGAGPWAGPPEALLDRDGEVHLFFLRYEKPPSRNWTQENLDLWHVRSTSGRTHWLPPNLMWRGYTGSINSAVQMRSGRIVVPFSYYTGRRWSKRGEGANAYTLFAPFSSTTVYSDDDGDTWSESPDEVKIVAATLTSQEAGAIEPVIIPLKDGRLWMLMRTQLGRFYESFSPDGARWTPAKPSNIVDSDSPAGIVRLKDGRLLLLWNCSLRYAYANGGRPVLLGAISDDEGRTWSGRREVLRDPHRDEPPPSPSGDFGTAYPFPLVMSDGEVLVATGQGRSRTTFVLDPRWLEQTTQATSFNNGIDDWSAYGTRGVELTALANSTKHALSIRRSDLDWPSGAVWNFPAGKQGRLRIRLRVSREFGGDTLGITDHFSAPFDDQDTFFNVFNIPIVRGGRLLGSFLAPDVWHTLQLSWNTITGLCEVTVDGKRVGTVTAQRSSPGVNYLRFHVTSNVKDDGLMIESAEVEVTPGEDATHARQNNAADKENRSDSR